MHLPSAARSRHRAVESFTEHPQRQSMQTKFTNGSLKLSEPDELCEPSSQHTVDELPSRTHLFH